MTTLGAARRIRRAQDAMGAAGVDTLVVAPSSDLVWLTGYAPPPLERLTALVVRPEGTPVLVVPRLERPLAEQQVPDGLVEIADWAETDDPYETVAAMAAPGRVACSDRLWASHLLALQGAVERATFVSGAGIFGPLRQVKDPEEVELLRAAAHAADAAFARLVDEEGLAARSERQVARRLGDLLLEHGHDEVAFTIVAAGENGASPHHEPTDRLLTVGDAVVLDFGGRRERYTSDISRTIAVGEPADGLPEVFEVVRAAQAAGRAAVRPGVPAEEVDRAARRLIDDAGYGDAFIHRTGHGIGLEDHEPPWIVDGNQEPLQPGMCFSVEPGIYLAGRFGVRIEDIVVVTEDGVDSLNEAGRDLVVLD